MQRVPSLQTVTNTEGDTTVTALCPSGTKVTGGGHRFFQGNSTVRASHLDPMQNGWTVTVGPSDTQATFEAVAVCAQ
ncbi:hypothetical protein [Streptomyces sp. NBC_01264]|uniref:hypothetical protein n=1 Tax=Streptomyces sp. NBC_01264 TaxID=2903804 RepID=UPI00225448AE|nr:hypothetical protein [Streptomyces sp. NBC_01264]MCX4775450.1 hypothetical protein [Streptomyces sp. NBC_01264]